MTDEQRFTEVMALMMGIQAIYLEPCPCSKCGTDLASWSPITPEGELTPECRKWLAENLPEAYDLYCADVYEQGYGRDLQAKYQYIELVRTTLDWRNLWKWMKENRDSWLYRKCTTCNGSGLWYRGGDKEFCISCNGTGRIARWDVEKWLEGK